MKQKFSSKQAFLKLLFGPLCSSKQEKDVSLLCTALFKNNHQIDAGFLAARFDPSKLPFVRTAKQEEDELQSFEDAVNAFFETRQRRMDFGDLVSLYTVVAGYYGDDFNHNAFCATRTANESNRTINQQPSSARFDDSTSDPVQLIRESCRSQPDFGFLNLFKIVVFHCNPQKLMTLQDLEAALQKVKVPFQVASRVFEMFKADKRLLVWDLLDQVIPNFSEEIVSQLTEIYNKIRQNDKELMIIKLKDCLDAEHVAHFTKIEKNPGQIHKLFVDSMVDFSFFCRGQKSRISKDDFVYFVELFSAGLDLPSPRTALSFFKNHANNYNGGVGNNELFQNDTYSEYLKKKMNQVMQSTEYSERRHSPTQVSAESRVSNDTMDYDFINKRIRENHKQKAIEPEFQDIQRLKLKRAFLKDENFSKLALFELNLRRRAHRDMCVDFEIFLPVVESVFGGQYNYEEVLQIFIALGGKEFLDVNDVVGLLK